jgi:hypothetical protein
MLNGLATRPFIRSGRNVGALASEVTDLFLNGFLGREAEDGRHDPDPVDLAAGADVAGRAGDARRV